MKHLVALTENRFLKNNLFEKIFENRKTTLYYNYFIGSSSEYVSPKLGTGTLFGTIFTFSKF